MTSVKRKTITHIGIICVALAMFCAALLYIIPSDARAFDGNIQVKNERVRVFIGSPCIFSENMDEVSIKYTTERHEYLNDLMKSEGNRKTASAVVVLDDYYTVDEVKMIAARYGLILDRAYLWMPGETGRLSLGLKDTTLDVALKGYIDDIYSKGIEDEEMMRDVARIANGEAKVFSITVTASYSDLIALHTASSALLVDVIYDEVAETKASREGREISYIELPFKPDGAL